MNGSCSCTVVELGNIQGRDWDSEKAQHRVEEQAVVRGRGQPPGGSSQAGCVPVLGSDPGCTVLVLTLGVSRKESQPLHYQGAFLKSIQVFSHVAVVEFPLIIL